MRNCLLQAISPFSNSLFYSFGELSAVFITSENAVDPRIVSVWKSLKSVIWEGVKGHTTEFSNLLDFIYQQTKNPCDSTLRYIFFPHTFHVYFKNKQDGGPRTLH